MDPTLGITSPASFTVLPPERCFELLAVATIGRVAFMGSAGLQLLPVSYRVVDRVVMLRVAAGGTLSELAEHHGEVVFEADHPSSLTRQGWSVLVRATCAVVTDVAVLAGSRMLALVPWTSGQHPLVLGLTPHQVTGRKVGWNPA